MKTTRKPRIGFLGLITDGYEQTFKGILARQEKYAHEVIATVSDVVDITFNGIATNQQEIIDIVSDYNSKKLDGIWIVLLAYSQGAWILRAMKDNKLPIALTVIQPDQEVLQDWDELDFTVNQGIHGAQDNCNVLHRLGVKYQVFAGNRHEQRFVDFIQDFGKAAQAFNRLKMMKIAIFSRMQGMGDVLTDDFGVFKTLGTEFCHDTIGTIYRYMQEITADEIDAQIERIKAILQ